MKGSDVGAYLVIIGDVINSRVIKERQKIQIAFQKALQEAQREYESDIISPLTLTIGDEFQAVLTEATRLFGLLQRIELQLPDVRFRYGIGIGAITTDINRQAAIGMDGPAFHFAREAVEQARRENRRFVFACGTPVVRRRVDLLFHWIDAVTGTWSREKQQILHLIRQKVTQKEIAARIGISQPAVSQHVRHQLFRLVAQSQEVVQNELNLLLGKSDG